MPCACLRKPWVFPRSNRAGVHIVCVSTSFAKHPCMRLMRLRAQLVHAQNILTCVAPEGFHLLGLFYGMKRETTRNQYFAPHLLLLQNSGCKFPKSCKIRVVRSRFNINVADSCINSRFQCSGFLYNSTIKRWRIPV